MRCQHTALGRLTIASRYCIAQGTAAVLLGVSAIAKSVPTFIGGVFIRQSLIDKRDFPGDHSCDGRPLSEMCHTECHTVSDRWTREKKLDASGQDMCWVKRASEIHPLPIT